MAPRLVYLVTEDWAFWRHRRPMARAARDAGYDVHVITNVSDRADAIRAEGFTLHPLDMKRGSIAPQAAAQSIARVRALFKAIQPALIHNVALQPIVIGSLAALSAKSVPIVNSIEGLGSVFIAKSLRAQAVRTGLRLALQRLDRKSVV